MLHTTVENILVVKLGGGEGLDLATACRNLAAIARQRPVVIVHGASARANTMCAQAGHTPRMLTSPSGHTSRYTDPITRDIFVQAAEQINENVVELLREQSINAIGLTGQSTIIKGERKSAIRAVVDGRVRVIRDDYSGSITQVDGSYLYHILQMGYVPVLPPLATSADGLLNVDGDRAAAAVASSLSAEELVILSNVRGLYRRFPDENSLVSHVRASEIEHAMDWAEGRMKRKVLGAREALDGGVRRVIISDGRIMNPVEQALAGAGTAFIQ